MPARAARAAAQALGRGGGVQGRATGLLGLPWLRQPQSLLAHAEHCRARCEALVQEAVAMPASAAVLHKVDQISESLCSALDVASLVSAVHPDPEWGEAAASASTMVGTTMARLNTDRRLNDALLRVKTSPSVRAALSEEQARFVELLLAEFEADGVHLPEQSQARVHALQGRIAGLGSSYMSALTREGAPSQPALSNLASAALDGGDGPLWVPSALVSALPASVGAALARHEGLVLLPDEESVTAAVLKWCPNERLRKAVFHRMHSVATGANLGTLAELLDARLDLARELGFASHTQMALAYGRVAGSEGEVTSFLSLVEDSTRDKLDAELLEMAAAKRSGRLGFGGGSSALGGWDVPFLTGALKASRWQVDSREISQYLELESALAGLSGLVSSLFGLSLHEQSLDYGEVWAPSVRKFALVDLALGSQPIGHIYLDLFKRALKMPINATFTVSAGARRHPAETAVSERAGPGGVLNEQAPLALPTVAIVCSFPGADEGAAEGARGSLRLLAHADLLTLYHEFGHALHALLGRTEMQHLSGVRGPLDFVECPSLLFERFASDWRVLRRWATHVRTGERIPEALVANMHKSTGHFVGYDTAVQTLYARTDLCFHGSSPPSRDSTAAVKALHERAFGPKLPWVDGTNWHANFGHFVSYSGGYYSYLWCRSLSAQLWHERFAEDPLSSSAGADLRRGLLEPGNARVPTAMLRDVLGGQDLSTEPLLRELSGSGTLAPHPDEL